jgi:hypothetical protein
MTPFTHYLDSYNHDQKIIETYNNMVGLADLPKDVPHPDLMKTVVDLYAYAYYAGCHEERDRVHFFDGTRVDLDDLLCRANRSFSEDFYNQIKFLVPDIYRECLESGMGKSAAAGKLQYELEPMAKTPEDHFVLYVELCALFASENNSDSFSFVYDKLKPYLDYQRDCPFEGVTESMDLIEEHLSI